MENFIFVCFDLFLFTQLKKSAFANTQLPGKQFTKQVANINTRQLKPSGFRAPASVSNNNVCLIFIYFNLFVSRCFFSFYLKNYELSLF